MEDTSLKEPFMLRGASQAARLAKIETKAVAALASDVRKAGWSNGRSSMTPYGVRGSYVGVYVDVRLPPKTSAHVTMQRRGDLVTLSVTTRRDAAGRNIERVERLEVGTPKGLDPEKEYRLVVRDGGTREELTGTRFFPVAATDWAP